MRVSCKFEAVGLLSSTMSLTWVAERSRGGALSVRLGLREPGWGLYGLVRRSHSSLLSAGKSRHVSPSFNNSISLLPPV